MTTLMKCCPVSLIAALLIMATSATARAQSTVTADQLLAEADQLKAAGEMTPEAANAIANQAVKILTAGDPAGPLDSGTMARLAKLAEPAVATLTAEQQQALQDALAGAAFNADDPNLESLNPTYDWLHFRVATMHASASPREVTQALVKEWIDAVGIEKLSVEMTRWCLEQMLPQKTDRNAFSVAWTGQLTPPSSGDYVFSVCPINVNKELAPDETVQHSMVVSVDGQQVVNANPDDWRSQGTPIQLQANQPKSLQVELNYTSTDGTYGDSPHALLYWEGPGISRQIVPTDVLTPPDGQEHGLRAQYRWTEAGQPLEVIQQDRNVEFAWATCRDVAPSDPELVAALSQRLWTLVTDPVYIAQQTADPPPKHAHPYFRNYTSTEFLTCAQRGEFLEFLQQTPELLRRADETQLLRLYQALRFGNAEGAVDMLGTWMQFHADALPALGRDDFYHDRRFYGIAALYLMFRAPDDRQYQQFQDRFLEMPNGDCCLSVAYTVAYCHLMNGSIDDWISIVDAKAENPNLSDDQRVNWLLARAYTEEIRYDPPGRSLNLPGRLSAGLPWIDEAALVVESPDVSKRIRMERIARLVATSQWDAAEEAMQAEPDLAAEWGEKLDSLKQQAEAAAQEQAEASRAAYISELERRRNSVTLNGDTTSAARYDDIIGTQPDDQ